MKITGASVNFNIDCSPIRTTHLFPLEITQSTLRRSSVHHTALKFAFAWIQSILRHTIARCSDVSLPPPTASFAPVESLRPGAVQHFITAQRVRRSQLPSTRQSRAGWGENRATARAAAAATRGPIAPPRSCGLDHPGRRDGSSMDVELGPLHHLQFAFPIILLDPICRISQINRYVFSNFSNDLINKDKPNWIS